MSSNFSSTQKIPQSATEHNKLTKVTSGYMKMISLRILILIKDTFVITVNIL